jgi:hypothetical protein
MTEYLIKFRKYAGQYDCWAESSERANARQDAILEIEDSDYEVACVLAVECIDNRYEARDVTASVMAEVADREQKRLTDKYYETQTDLTLDAFLWCHAKFARAA